MCLFAASSDKENILLLFIKWDNPLSAFLATLAYVVLQQFSLPALIDMELCFLITEF